MAPRRGAASTAPGLPALQRRGANAAIVQRAARLNARGSRGALSRSAQAPIQCAGGGAGKWLRWGGASLAALSVGAMAMGAAPLGLAGLGLLAGGAALVGGLMAGDGARQPAPNYGTRPRSGVATDPGWYDRRAKTAYSHTTGLGHQGPHTVPHIGKRVTAEHAIQTDPMFDPVAISQRTGVIPSPGQGRALLREYEEATGSTIPDAHKKQWDAQYKDAISRRDTGTHEERVRATRDAMELNPLATYSLHQKASHDEIKGKGERRKTVTPDLELMRGMKKTDPMPKFAKVDFPKTPVHKTAHLHKLVRDTGQLYGGNDDLSEFELDSDEEYK